MPDDQSTTAAGANAEAEAEPERPYRQRPPLWESSKPPDPGPRALRLLVYVSPVAMVVMLLGGERLVTTEPRMIQVEVVSTQNAAQTDGPPSFRMQVRMPDGRVVPYLSPRLHTVGDQIDVIYSEGRVTGRVHLAPPERTTRE